MKLDAFRFYSGAYSDALLDVTSGDHGVTFSLRDEKEGYNAEITCVARLPMADAERLRDWLIEALK